MIPTAVGSLVAHRNWGCTRYGMTGGLSVLLVKRRWVVKASFDTSLYEILGVAPSASGKEIKQAYRRLALKFHPDVNKQPDAQVNFLRIKQAYQTLIDPLTRAKYESSKKASERRKTADEWSKGKRDEDFYGLGDLLRDATSSIEEFFRDLQVEYQKRKGQPKSLWEEVGEIGEEFVEFLEKELKIDEEVRGGNNSGRNRVQSESSSDDEEREKEIEDSLQQLKKELGMQ